jgi:hypothetical protein
VDRDNLFSCWATFQFWFYRQLSFHNALWTHPKCMVNLRRTLLLIPLLLATTMPPAFAQHRGNFNDGVRHGGHGGQYDDRHYHDDHRNDRNSNQGGIGPGKGALIGAAGGAALGAVFGGGLKGTIVGGAAGAGIGAVLGQANQNSKQNNYYRR